MRRRSRGLPGSQPAGVACRPAVFGRELAAIIQGEMLCRPYFVSPFCFVHFADYKLENAKNYEEKGFDFDFKGLG